MITIQKLYNNTFFYDSSGFQQEDYTRLNICEFYRAFGMNFSWTLFPSCLSVVAFQLGETKIYCQKREYATA